MNNNLKLAGSTYRPWLILKSDDKFNCNGISCDLIKYLSRSLNFTYEFVYQKEVLTGYQLENGSWTGAIGLIQSGQADLTATPIALSVEPFTQKIVDHAQPYHFGDAVVITRYDDSLIFPGYDIVNILGKNSWIIFNSLILFTFILMVLLDKYFLKERQSFFKRISIVAFLLTAMFLGKDIQFNSTLNFKLGNVVLMTSWLFSSFQLSMIISGEITTMFSLKLPNKQIETLEELLDSKLSLVAYSGFLATQAIQDHNVLKRIKHKVEQDQTSVKISDIFQNKDWIINTSEGKAAIVLGRVSLKTLAILYSKYLGLDTKFHFLDEKYRSPFLITIASSTRLPKEFRTMLNLKVLQYTSTGVIYDQLRRSLTKSDKFFYFKDNVDANYQQIELDNLFGLFEFTSLLLIICMIIGIFEFCHFSLES